MRPSIALLALTLCATLGAQVPAPRDVIGHDIGEDFFLADYTQLRAYWDALAARSDRMIVETYGETSYGQPMVMAVISSPDNLARLDELRALNRRLVLGRDDDEAVARELAARGRSIVWIDAGMHATEAVAAQNIIELTYRMTSRDDDEVRRILDRVVLVVVPANPDGLEMIARAYSASRHVGGLPVLYQRYIGHDNNRDYYAVHQAETKAIAHALYHRWLPQVVYNHHQSAPRGTVIFTPPFRDPFNYNFDPIAVRGVEIVAAHINRRFASEAKSGVISRGGARYSQWWNGGLRTTAAFHNMIGILTESFGTPDPRPLEQRLDRRLPSGDYPDPVPSGEWHARQTIEYLQTANFAVLDYVARYADEVVLDQWRMARRSIERGRRDHWTPTPKLVAIAKARDARSRTVETAGGEGGGAEPHEDLVDVFADPELRDARAYVLPSDQRDFTAAVRLARSLRHVAVEVHRAAHDVTVGGRAYPAGSLFVFADQAFRPHLRDMFEPQWYPELDSGPYDAAGWALALQVDVEVDRVLDDFDRAGLEPVGELDVAFPFPAIDGEGDGFVAPHAEFNAFAAANRLLAAGERVAWLEEPVAVGDRRYGRGALFVAAGEATEARVRELARDLGVPFRRTDDPGGPRLELRRPRVGLFDVYGGHMPTGWTEWLLRDNGFDVELVFGPDVNAGKLRDQFDVLVFHTGLPVAGGRDRMQRALRRGRSTVDAATARKIVAALPPFEDWSTAEARRVPLEFGEAIPSLLDFVTGGGVLIALGGEASRAIKHFDLPVEEGVRLGVDRRRASNSEFSIPGSLVWIDVDTDDPVGWGCSPQLAAMFRKSPVFTVGDVADGEPQVRSVADYVETDALASGWARGVGHLAGKSAALRVDYGDGTIHLFGADVVYRAQPLGTIKMLFNAILSGCATAVR